MPPGTCPGSPHWPRQAIRLPASPVHHSLTPQGAVPPPPPSCCPESSLLLLPAHTIPSPRPFSLLLLLPLPFHKTPALFLNPTMSILHPCLSYSSSPSIPHAASTPWSQSHLQALALTQQNPWGQWNAACPVASHCRACCQAPLSLRAKLLTKHMLSKFGTVAPNTWKQSLSQCIFAASR